MAQITAQEPVRRKDAGTVELDDAVFGIQPNVPVMHQVVTAQLAHRRAGTQSTKTRAEVRGGGAKPYRQKGTGNARQGSTRSPHYSGGGVALGPKPPQVRPADPEEDDPAGPALGAVRPGRRGQGRRRRRLGLRRPDHQGRHGGARARSASRVACSWSSTARRRHGCPELPQPPRGPADPAPASSTPTTCCATTGSCSPAATCPTADAPPTVKSAAEPDRRGRRDRRTPAATATVDRVAAGRRGRRRGQRPTTPRTSRHRGCCTSGRRTEPDSRAHGHARMASQPGGLRHQGQRRLDALPHARQRLLRPHGRRGLVRHRSRPRPPASPSRRRSSRRRGRRPTTKEDES